MSNQNDKARARDFIFRSLDSDLTPRVPRPVMIDDLQREFTTIRQEERRAAFKDAIAAVPQVGVTFPEGYEEWIDAPSYRESVIAALEAAANEAREDEGP